MVSASFFNIWSSIFEFIQSNYFFLTSFLPILICISFLLRIILLLTIWTAFFSFCEKKTGAKQELSTSVFFLFPITILPSSQPVNFLDFSLVQDTFKKSFWVIFDVHSKS